MNSAGEWQEEDCCAAPDLERGSDLSWVVERHAQPSHCRPHLASLPKISAVVQVLLSCSVGAVGLTIV